MVDSGRSCVSRLACLPAFAPPYLVSSRNDYGQQNLDSLSMSNDRHTSPSHMVLLRSCSFSLSFRFFSLSS